MKKTLSLVLAGLVFVSMQTAFADGTDSSATATTDVPTTGSSWFGNGIKDNGPHKRANTFFLYAQTGYVDNCGFGRAVGFGLGFGFGCTGGYGAGLGFRYGLTLIQDGFIPQVNNSFDLEFGADVNMILAGYLGVGFAPVAAADAKWSFYFTDRLAAYAKVGLAVGVGFVPGFTGILLSPEFFVGGNWRFAEKMTLRAEVGGKFFFGYFYGVRVGVTF